MNGPSEPGTALENSASGAKPGNEFRFTLDTAVRPPIRYESCEADLDKA